VPVNIVALWTKPNDPEGFEKHYFSTHIPLVNALPGLKGATTSKALNGPYFRIAELRFEDMDSLGAAMGSEPAQKLMADTAHIQETFATNCEVLTCEVDPG
jgi:uncharacterized protein (TIGR02118 family)